MIAGVNAMERLGSIITNKNSRICADFDIDAAKKSFQEKFYIENECNEIVYEYAVSYLQIIAEIISAVKITSKERNSLYWRIAEVAKKLGLFVICEIEQEELGYILENTTKVVAENRIIDAVIINIDLEDNNNDQKIFQFLGLLKKAKKAVFIKVKEGQEKPKRRWWELFSKKKEKTYDKENTRPVLKCSICSGEQVAGFKDIHTGKFEEVMLIRGEKDLKEFMETYGIETVSKEY